MLPPLELDSIFIKTIRIRETVSEQSITTLPWSYLNSVISFLNFFEYNEERR